MERKTKIEIGFAIAVVLLCIAFFIYWRNQAVPAPIVAVTPTPAITTSKDKTTKTPTSSTKTPVPEVATPVGETSAVTVARTFVERLGSYSSEADAANIEDIIPMATTTFQKKLEALVKEIRSSAGGTFYSVSTLVVTAPKTLSSSATNTVLSMTTQRVESKGDPGTTTKKYQTITVTLVKSGTTWLVDGYTWKDGI